MAFREAFFFFLFQKAVLALPELERIRGGRLCYDNMRQEEHWDLRKSDQNSSLYARYLYIR